MKELQRLARKAQWEQGARDPALINDLSENEAAFKSADAETARRIS